MLPLDKVRQQLSISGDLDKKNSKFRTRRHSGDNSTSVEHVPVDLNEILNEIKNKINETESERKD